MIEPVERALNLREGVRSTRPGAPPPPKLPPLSNDAMQLLAPLFREGADQKAAIAAIVEQESRTGAQALAWLAAVLQEGARAMHGTKSDSAREWAGQLQQLSEAMSKVVDATEAVEKAKVEDAIREQLSHFYALGYEAGAKDTTAKLAEDASKPTLVREVEFHEDQRGHVVGKTEREYSVREASK